MSHVSNIREALGSHQALVMTDAVSIRYATGFHIDDGAAVITHDGAWVITDSRYVEAATAAPGHLVFNRAVALKDAFKPKA